METFIMFKDLMGNIFPSDWMTMNLQQMQVFLRAINLYSDVLNQIFLDPAHFHLEVSFPAFVWRIISSISCKISSKKLVSH